MCMCVYWHTNNISIVNIHNNIIDNIIMNINIDNNNNTTITIIIMIIIIISSSSSSSSVGRRAPGAASRSAGHRLRPVIYNM